MTFFWLADGEVTGQCSKNLVLSPKSPCSSWRPRRKNSDPAPRMHFCLLTLPLFLHPFPWLATVWTSPLELREDQEGWMKPISYKKETRNMKRTPLHQQCPSQFCKGHNIITWNLDLPLGKWHNPAKKGRGKDGLLTASKENIVGVGSGGGGFSQSSVPLNSKAGEVLSQRCPAYSWRASGRGKFSIELGQRSTGFKL